MRLQTATRESTAHVPLGRVVRFIRGVTFGPNDPVPHGTPESVVCMRTKNIQQTLDESDLLAVPTRVVKRDEQFLRPNDILVSSANSWNLVGKCVPVPRLAYRATAGGFISILRADPKQIDASYLYRWLSWDATQEQARSCARQTTNIANLSVDRFLELEVPLPSLPDQRRIAALLDKADAIRRKRQQAIRLADKLLRSAFLEMFGDPVTNPNSYPSSRLDRVAEIASGVTKGRKLDGSRTVTVPYMRVANVQDGHLALADVKEIEALPEEIARYRLRGGDVLLTEGGDPDKLGRGAVWQGAIDPCIHQNHVFRVRPDTRALLPGFLSAQLGSLRGKRYFARAAKQTTGIASINMTQLRAFPVLLAPLDRQARFVAVVEHIRHLGGRLQKRHSALDQMLDAITNDSFGR